MAINFYSNDIKTSVNSLLIEIYPERDYTKQIGYISEELDKFNMLFNEFAEIGKKKHKYNLNWAYKNAQDKFTELSGEILKKQLEKKKKLKLDSNIREEYSIILKRRKEIEKGLKMKFQLFTFMSSLVSVIDMILSLMLIFVISHISRRTKVYISSEILSGIFVFFFAFLKVTLGKYFMAPRVGKLGWKLYERSINQYKKDIIVITTMTLVTHEGIVNDIGVKNVVKSLKRGIKILKKSKIENLRN